MNSEASSRAPTDVREGQVWELSIKGGPARRATVLRVTAPIFGARYVFLRRLTDGRSVRVPLRRLQHEDQGARLVEEASEDRVERKAPPAAEVVERHKPSSTVHEPRMSISDRRQAVSRAHLLRARGSTVNQIANVLGVRPEVVEVWLAEEPTEGT
jgi:hypothetical protein